MRKSELKLKLHNMVDMINDEVLLLNFYNAFSYVQMDSEKDTYQLTDEQNNRLAESLLQYKNGNVIDDREVRKQLSSWIGK